MLPCVVRDAVIFSSGGEGDRGEQGGGKRTGGWEGGRDRTRRGFRGGESYLSFFSSVTLLQGEFCPAAKTFSPDTCVSLPRCLSFFVSLICFR